MRVLLGLALVGALAALDAPWWLRGLVVPPALLWGPGLPWAAWLDRRAAAPSALRRGLDAAWIGLGFAWLDVALVRETGLPEPWATGALLLLAAAWTLLGLRLAPRRPRARLQAGEALGLGAVALSLLAFVLLRGVDVARPLDGYWWLADADAPGHERAAVEAGEGWAEVHPIGWPEAGATRLRAAPGEESARLRATAPVDGRVILAIRGPIGAWLEVDPPGPPPPQRVVVERSPQEPGEEGPVRRYLDRGVAALAVPLVLAPGESLPVRIGGPRAPEDAVYLLPGTDAVWSAHAAGELRYTHYWQILNQVENLDWAQAVRRDLRFTLHQPPGWSPVLALGLSFVEPGLRGANALFLWVCLLLGATLVRLVDRLWPHGPAARMLLPGGLAAAVALLMIEPGSGDFPDPLYAVALLSVAGALLEGRARWFAALGVAAGLLRWPGVVASSLLALAWLHAPGGALVAAPGLRRLWALTALGLALAILGAWSGELPDLGFILWFETFPEHWHGESDPLALLARAPGFYALWAVYTGGGLLVAALALLQARGPTARRGRALLLGALLYSTLLATIDHHPTHYFLPLVALCGPAVAAGLAATRDRRIAALGLGICLLGLWIFVRSGRVW